MDVGSFLVANAQSPKLVQPSERPLHDPAPSAQSTAMFGVALQTKKAATASATANACPVGIWIAGWLRVKVRVPFAITPPVAVWDLPGDGPGVNLGGRRSRSGICPVMVPA